MSWQDRVNSVIELTSPLGDFFTPKWVGNDRTNGKKLGKFTFPKKDGTVEQDLGLTGWVYPLTVTFDGSDHDLEAERFANSFKQVGRWQVQHPTKGGLELQLESVSESIQPVTDSNNTRFELQFFEPANSSIIESKQNLKSRVLSSGVQSDSNALERFANGVSIASARGQTAIKNAVGKIQDIAGSVLGPIAQINGSVNSLFLAIQRGISDTLDATVLDTLSLAGQIKALIQTPALIKSSLQAKIDLYAELANEILEIESDDDGAPGKNVSSVKELAMSSAMTAITSEISKTDLTTKSEALSAIEANSLLFTTINNGMDLDQEKFLDSSINNQYVSFLESYSILVYTVQMANDYLLRASFNLRVEKKFKITKPRTPIDVCVSEYGNDSFLDLFISTNNLKDIEIILLPAGRELVVYL